MRALVTGGAGFIGHHLVRALVARRDDVVVFDDFSTGLRNRVSQSGASRIIEGDLREGPSLVEALEGREVVFHLAAIASVSKSMIDPTETNSVNVDGTIRLMIEAARSGVRRVVVASSSAIYGGDPGLPSRESQRPDPLSPYATSKLAMECYAHNLGVARGIETIALRYFNVYGPGQDPNAEYAAVVPRFILAALGDGQPTIYGDGHQTRDFTFVGDVVAANLAAGDEPVIGGLTANIGSGRRTSLLDLLRSVEEATGRMLDTAFEDQRQGDVRDSQADVSLAAQQLGYMPQVDLSEGIRHSVAWYRTTYAVGSAVG